MNLIGAVLICSVVSSGLAIWIQEVISPRGLDIGGVRLRLEDTREKNVSLLERIAVRMDYGNFGVSLAKKPKERALDVRVYDKGQFEGREKKKGDMTIPFLMGAKIAGIVTIIITTMKMLVFKALAVAKMALIASGIMLIKKLFKHEPSHYPVMEIEPHGSEHYPVFADYGPSAGGFQQATGQASNYYGYNYNNYAPSAGSESVLKYATAEAPDGNATFNESHQEGAASTIKRRDYSRKKLKPSFLAVRRYVVPS